jgi:hypothetical protein
MVSMLIEYGFMDEKEDSQRLLDENFRKKCAESTLKGIMDAYGIDYTWEEDEEENEDEKFKILWQQEKIRADKAEERLKQISNILNE